MTRKTFGAGAYFIGDLRKILSYEDALGLNSGFGKVREFSYANFEVGVRDSGIMGSDGFNYCIDSENLGLIDARIIDEELLSERILTLHAGILANKFTMFKLARVAQFGAEFSVFQDATKINFGGIIFDLS